jgi:hypothetical protein
MTTRRYHQQQKQSLHHNASAFQPICDIKMYNKIRLYKEELGKLFTQIFAVKNTLLSVFSNNKLNTYDWIRSC